MNYIFLPPVFHPQKQQQNQSVAHYQLEPRECNVFKNKIFFSCDPVDRFIHYSYNFVID